MRQDEYYMRRALELARKAQGRTSPNPMAGCVVVKGGKVIAEGYHRKAGLPHAEIEALNRAKDRARGSTLYVNLEPCYHWGRTPPCVDKLISCGIKRVIIATKDPNPQVRGKSIRRLRKAGIKVELGVLEAEAKRLNEVFFINMKAKRPFVAAKIAQTLDGKIATSKGDSKWITSLSSRRYARRLRGLDDAILVGSNTVISDNPSLDSVGKRLIKVILDPDLKISPRANMFKKAKRVFIFTKSSVSKKKKQGFKGKATIVSMPYSPKGFDVKKILKLLYSEGVSSVFVEGGSLTLGRFFDRRLVDKVYVFVAFKIMGKASGLDPVGGRGDISMDRLIRLKGVVTERIGEDLFLTGYPLFK